jgi:hypothetical protein
MRLGIYNHFRDKQLFVFTQIIMRTLLQLFIIVILACCAGCGKVVPFNKSVQHTAFLMSHNPKTYLESVAKSKGYDVAGGGISQSLGGTTGEKTFSVSIKGDENIRDEMMRDYQKVVEGELVHAGVSIYGREAFGKVCGFRFSYETTNTTGFIRANAVPAANGYIEFDIIIYEHN